eukprot:scaffold70865_cov27-Cyclotella_meneghiniana.AAC.2
MSSNEDDVSESSHEHDEASESYNEHDELIERLEINHPSVKYIDMNFYFRDLEFADVVVETNWHDDANRYQTASYRYTLSDPAVEWERLGRALGRCNSIYEVELRKVGPQLEQIVALAREMYQCIDTLYRGLECNTSIEKFELDMDLFPSSGAFPTFNLNGALFKENLKLLSLSSEIPIGINQSLMVLPLLESTSLDSFSISQCNFANDVAVYTRIISACTRVQRLYLKFIDTPEIATSVATLLRDERSILTQFSLCKDISAANLPIVLDGLASNTTLKTLYLPNIGLERSQFERLLCNASSIDGIHNSNHTLELVLVNFSDWNPDSDSMSVQQIQHFFSPFLKEFLELNKDTNKEKVIRTKIARYYFRGEFDIAPFLEMDLNLLPKVMAMIRGRAIRQRDAIYRLLKSIPDLCRFPSDVSRKRKNNILQK